MNSCRQFGIVTDNVRKSEKKLSSGYKINNAADAAAGLSLSEKMRRQIRGTGQGIENCREGADLLQTADYAMQEIQDILNRANELAVRCATDTMTEEDRSYCQEELNQITDEIDALAEKTTYNNMQILKGGVFKTPDGRVISDVQAEAEGFDTRRGIQFGANTDHTIMIKLAKMGIDECGMTGADVSTRTASLRTIEQVKDAIYYVNGERNKMGSYSMALEHAVKSMGVYQENAQDSESRVRDTDMAAEMLNFTTQKILENSGSAALANSNHSKEAILKLLEY
jgi:flagellin